MSGLVYRGHVTANRVCAEWIAGGTEVSALGARDTIKLITRGLGARLPEDYQSAAIRHFEDATALRASDRPDNAGHLIGFAAECAIKYRITSLRPGQNSPHGHFPEILVAARKHLGARSSYTSMYELLKADIFRGWDVNSRYQETGHTEQQELIKWFSVTKRLFATASLKVPK